MLNIIVELSKYLILIIMLLYTLESFLVFRYEEDYDQRYILRKQLLLIIFLDLTAFLVIFLQTEELKVLYIFGALILYLVIVQALYRALYKTSSILLLNHMCMLLSIGFIMLARLDPDSGLRQMAIAVAATVLAMVIPVMIRKMYFLKKLTWLYAVVGFLMLAVVLVAGSNVNGAKININIGSFAFQPSEFVKIIFVFFVASRLYKKSATFLDHVITTAVAAAYVLVLVLSRDLGSAVVFFITYVVGGIFHYLCGHALCGHQEAFVSFCGSGKRLPGGGDRLFPVFSCKTESCCLERSFLCMGNFRLPDPPGTFCYRRRRLVRRGPVQGIPGTDPLCAAGLYVRGDL